MGRMGVEMLGMRQMRGTERKGVVQQEARRKDSSQEKRKDSGNETDFSNS